MNRLVMMRVPSTTPLSFLTRRGRALGGWLVILGVLLNEWVLRNFSYDGVFTIHTRLSIWTFDVSAVALGLMWRAAGIRAIPAADSLRHKRMSSLFVGCLVSAGVTVGLIACAEGVSGWLNYRASLKAEKDEDEYHSLVNRHDSILGYRLLPGRTARVAAKVKGRVVVNAVYTLDGAGRRLTPGHPSRDAAGTLLFFGDSFTFGEWVNDDDTMPFTITQLTPQYQVYNYGVPGYGPQHILAKLEGDAILSEVDAVPPVIGVYAFIDAHVDRAIGSMHHYASWMADCPYYDFNASGTGVVRKGSFRTGRPWRSALYGFFGRSQILRYFNVNWPIRPSKRDVDLTCRIIEASRDRFQALFGSDRFYVLFYPGSSFGETMIPQLEARGVRTLDYSQLVDYWRGTRYQLPGCDNHPTALTHRLVAVQLVHDLNLMGSDENKQFVSKPSDDPSHRLPQFQVATPASGGE